MKPLLISIILIFATLTSCKDNPPQPSQVDRLTGVYTGKLKHDWGNGFADTTYMFVVSEVANNQFMIDKHEGLYLADNRNIFPLIFDKNPIVDKYTYHREKDSINFRLYIFPDVDSISFIYTKAYSTGDTSTLSFRGKK